MLIKGTTVIEKKMCYISHAKNVVVVARGMCKRDFCYRVAQERLLLQRCTREIFLPESCRENFSRGVALINDCAAVGRYYSLKCNSVRKMFFCQRVVQKSFSCLRVLQERIMILCP